MANVWRVLLLCLLMPLAGFAAGADRLTIGTAHQLHSSVLNEDRDYQLYLPRSYDWALDRQYPVLLVLDGQTDFVHSASSVDYLAARGEIPEVIVVGLTSTVRVRDFTQTDWAEAWVGGGGAADFKTFLATELLPEIEANHRSNGFRVLSGHSAGGQFALYCLSEQPDLFQAYFAISPSLDWDHNLPQRALEQSLIGKDELKSFVYLAHSDDSGRALADYRRVVQTLQMHAPRGLRWHSQPFPMESHSGIPLLAQIDALRQLYSGYRLSDDLLDQGYDYAEQHFQRVSALLGYPIPVPEGVLNQLAYAALQSNQTAAAIELFGKNAEANPNSANAQDGLTDGYAQAGRWAEATETAKRALALAEKFQNPNMGYFRQQLQKMQKAQGEPAAE